MRQVLFAVCMPFFALPAFAQAECPAAATARTGIEFSVGESVTTVRPLSGPVIEKVLALASGARQTSLLYEGLFVMEETTVQNKTSQFKPSKDLKAFFPVSVGAEISFDVTVVREGRELPDGTVKLRVIGQRAFKIGACGYDVFLIEREILKEGRPAERYVEYYAPALRYVVAKEFQERGSALTVRSYSKVRAAVQGGAPI